MGRRVRQGRAEVRGGASCCLCLTATAWGRRSEPVTTQSVLGLNIWNAETLKLTMSRCFWAGVFAGWYLLMMRSTLSTRRRRYLSTLHWSTTAKQSCPRRAYCARDCRSAAGLGTHSLVLTAATCTCILTRAQGWRGIQRKSRDRHPYKHHGELTTEISGFAVLNRASSLLCAVGFAGTHRRTGRSKIQKHSQ